MVLDSKSFWFTRNGFKWAFDFKHIICQQKHSACRRAVWLPLFLWPLPPLHISTVSSSAGEGGETMMTTMLIWEAMTMPIMITTSHRGGGGGMQQRLWLDGNRDKETGGNSNTYGDCHEHHYPSLKPCPWQLPQSQQSLFPFPSTLQSLMQ